MRAMKFMGGVAITLALWWYLPTIAFILTGGNSAG